MNLFSEGAYKLDIKVSMTEGDFAMEYNSQVLASGSKASWNGRATVYCLNARFEQQCRSYCEDLISCKNWRGVMVPSDSVSPMCQIQSWQELVGQGKGYYHKKPAQANKYSGSLEGIPGTVYAVEMKDVPLNINALCDAHLDNIFGGAERYKPYTSADIIMLYGTKDLKLKAVVIVSEASGATLAAVISINESEEKLDFRMEDFKLQEGLLQEEWDLVTPEK